MSAGRDVLTALSDEAAASALGYAGAGDMSVGVVTALESVRLAVLAAAEPPEPVTATLETLDVDLDVLGWKRVELFGHTVVYGHVAEVLVADRRFLEVTVPAVTGRRRHRFAEPPDEVSDEEVSVPEHRKVFNPSAVYAMEPSTEQAVAENVRRRAGLEHDAALCDPSEGPF